MLAPGCAVLPRAVAARVGWSACGAPLWAANASRQSQSTATPACLASTLPPQPRHVVAAAGLNTKNSCYVVASASAYVGFTAMAPSRRRLHTSANSAGPGGPSATDAALAERKTFWETRNADAPDSALLVWTHRRAKDIPLLQKVVSKFKENGVKLFVHASDVDTIGGDVPYSMETMPSVAGEIDFIVSFGSRSPSRSRVSMLFPLECPPVLAIRNRELTLESSMRERLICEKLELVIRGHFQTCDRLRFDCVVGSSGGVLTAKHTLPAMALSQHYTAVHEVVVHRAPTPVPVHTDLFVDGEYFSEVVADGVILATPSGSRLYSRAAGGALVYPFIQCFQVVPLNPMSLSFRPVILSSEATMTIRRTTSGEQSLLIDGAQATLRGNDIIQVTTSQHPLPSIRLWDQPDPMTYEV